MTTKIPGKIIDSEYIAPPEPSADPHLGAHWERPECLPSVTYRLSPPTGPSGYLTIADDPATGQPVELFFNSRDQSQAAWVLATTRLASRALQWGIPVDRVVKDMSRVDDPEGGYWTQGQYVGSLVAHIGVVMQRHANRRGQAVDEPSPEQVATYEAPKGRACPVCGERAMQWLDGCWTCTACGHSKCG